MGGGRVTMGVYGELGICEMEGHDGKIARGELFGFLEFRNGLEWFWLRVFVFDILVVVLVIMAEVVRYQLQGFRKYLG
jgi:hypothetical protein